MEIEFHPHTGHQKFTDHTGRVYTHLTVLGYAPPRVSVAGNKSPAWWCKCVCGTVKSIREHQLKYGKAKSCGCRRWEMISKSNTTHGMKHTVEYNAWKEMKQRCDNPKMHAYHSYGGRGITVCERWSHSFENFLQDVGRKPSHLHSIDRINNDGNYEPGNVRWATKKEQGRNRRSNTHIEHNGQSLCVSEWCEVYGLHTNTFLNRLNRGWSIERSLTTSPRTRGMIQP